MPTFTDSDAIFNSFLNYMNFEKNPDVKLLRLERMNALGSLFKHPELCYKTLHIAGSKGKGSLSTMLSSILSEHGLKTGLYTSPHIESYKERITLNTEFFLEEDYLSQGQCIQDFLDKANYSLWQGQGKPTFFELMTLLAFLLFKHTNCDWGVFEVGMGGRLDSTNIISPEACVITPIELEHTEYLGDTLEKIAFEKGGIIKEHTPVFISEQKSEVKEVFKAIAKEKNAPIYFIEDAVDHYTFENTKEGTNAFIEYKDKKLFPDGLKLKLSMTGELQVKNASLAAYCARMILKDIPIETIEIGLHKALLKARFEQLNDDIVIDGAHTEASTKAASQTFHSLYGKGILLFGCALDKDPELLSESFKNNFTEVIITRPGTFKPSDLERMEKAFRKRFAKVSVIPETEEAVHTAKKLKEVEKLPLLVCGSFYLASIARSLLKEEQ